MLKKHHAHLCIFLLLIGVSIGVTLSFFNPPPARVKEVVNPSASWPNAPQNLRSSANTYDVINLAWDAPLFDEFTHLPAESYVVYKSLTGNDFDSLTPFASTNSTFYNDSTVSPNTTYYYKVAAVNTSGEGPNSAVSIVTTPQASSPPSQTPVFTPTNFTATVSSSRQIDLAWNAAPGVDGYQIYHSSDGSAYSMLTTTAETKFSDTTVFPATKYYYYLVSVKGSAVSTPTFVINATTPADVITPTSTTLIISGIQVLPDQTSARISWDTNRPTEAEVVYGISPPYTSVAKSTTVGNHHEIVLGGLVSDTTYHFKINASDSAHYSASSPDQTFNTSKVIVTQPLKVSKVGLVAEGKSFVITWLNPNDPGFVAARVVRTLNAPAAQPDQGELIYTGASERVIDDTVERNITYYYTVFVQSTNAVFGEGVSVSGKIGPLATFPPVCNEAAPDCNNVACKANPRCLPKPPATSLKPIITKPVVVSDISFLVGDKKITLTPKAEMVASLEGEKMFLKIPEQIFSKKPDGLTLAVADGSTYNFIYNEQEKLFSTEIVTPPQGWYEAELRAVQKNVSAKTGRFIIRSVVRAEVYNESNQGVDNFKAALYNADGSLFNAEYFGQTNPYEAKNGRYGWVVPNGIYEVRISKPGYNEYRTSFNIVSNIVSQPLVLETKNVGLPATVISLVGGNTNAFRVVMDKLSKFLREIGVPVSAGLAVVGALAQLSFIDILALLRLLFLQPLLLIGSRKRYAWGLIYNALNKLPLDLAIVRLINTATNKVVQTRVTSRNGKYFFTTSPGSYRLEVLKEGMTAPSKLLMGYSSDGRKTDLYHGEDLIIKDAYPVVAVNIPADPKEDSKTPARLRLEKIGRVVQLIISGSGLLMTVMSIVMNPTTWYLWGFLLLHSVVFLLFWRLSIPPKPKGWGVVHELLSNKPISRAVARLFNTQFNKLVSTQITDHHGRYYFLAGDSTYFVRFEHPDYEVKNSGIINLTGKEEENIALNVGLKKKN